MDLLMAKPSSCKSWGILIIENIQSEPIMPNYTNMLNKFLLGHFDQVVKDIPADRMNERPAGDGHPPLWVLGHLAVCVDLGQSLLGGEFKHPDWLKVFGPGSDDEISDPGNYSASDFIAYIHEGYPRLAVEFAAADSSLLAELHGIRLLSGTTIQTRGDLLAHLISTHFAFHLAQLSTWRRAAGQPPLF
jgi:hypothetical protein